MKKVLIVLKDVALLSTLKSWHVRYAESSPLFFANEGTQALNIMQSESIDLLITELDLPEIDGVELVGTTASHYPTVKVVVLLSIDGLTVADCKRLKTFRSVYFALKPDSEKEFENFLNVLNVVDHQALSAADINIADFLKLIECQKKTCLLAIEQKNNSQKALVYFENGVLYDAINGLLKSEAAVSEILTWTQPQLIFRPPIQKAVRRKIFFDLDELINEQEKNNESNTDNALDALIEQVLAKAEERIKMEEAKAKEKAETQQLPPVETASKLAEPTKAISISPAELENILKPLRSINDYFASAVFDMSGNLVAQHTAREYDIKTLAENIAALIKTIANSANNIGLGESNFIQLNCNNSILVAVWESTHQLIAVLLLEPNSKLIGLAKMNLITGYQAMLKQLDD